MAGPRDARRSPGRISVLGAGLAKREAAEMGRRVSPSSGPWPDACCTPVAAPNVTPSETAQWATIFRALSDPTRLGILALLAAQRQPLCVCDIVARFPLEQPTISHHLKVLRKAGLVSAERRALWVYYRPSDAGLMEAWRAIGRLIP